MTGFKKILLSSAVSISLLGLFSGAVFAAQNTNQNAVITGSVVNLRETADTTSKILDKLPKGTTVSVIKVSDNWYNINYDNTQGWVSADYISLKETTLGTGIVTTEILNLRSKPDTASDVVSKLKQNDKVTLLERSNDWYRIKTSDGDAGWVSSEFITIRKSSVSRGDDVNRDDTADTSDFASSSGDAQIDSSIVQSIVDYAKKFVGEDYVYGGDTPKEGFDCSGFTKYVFAKFGIDLERTAADQASQGTKVLKADLKPGDLLLFDTNGGHNSINHVGIYIGNGRFIHASSPRTGVVITDLSMDYYQRAYMRARRIINQ
jgi:cell wall-associated NlpC family hydrolase